jgi:2'-5' RNA ligase
MGSDPTAAHRRIPAGEGLNVYALVIYIPDPLGRFLDDLRRELAPGCNPHAHVSVLPPRPLAVEWEEASQFARELAGNSAPFDVELSDVSMFPVTNVVYLEVGKGAPELVAMHRATACGPLGFDEPFVYHPHITLAQEIAMESLPEVRETACRRWREYRGPRNFLAEQAVFVQNTLHNCWVDLAEFRFGSVPVKI